MANWGAEAAGWLHVAETITNEESTRTEALLEALVYAVLELGDQVAMTRMAQVGV